MSNNTNPEDRRRVPHTEVLTYLVSCKLCDMGRIWIAAETVRCKCVQVGSPTGQVVS